MNGSGPMTSGGNGAGVLDLKKIYQSGWIYHLIRITISGVFIWSGITKLMALKEFSSIIESYGLIPDAWTLPVAHFLSVLEVVAGFGLLLDICGYGIWMGLDIDCGCFGPQDPESKAFHGLWAALIRDTFMVLAIVYLYYQRLCRNLTPKRLRSVLKIIKKEEDE